MIKIINCDVFKSGADFVLHQINCQGVMGSGVAKQVREKHPEVYSAYVTLCNKYIDNTEMKKFFDDIDYDSLVSRAVVNESLIYYVACFSSESDLLSQWRGYANDGKGKEVQAEVAVSIQGTSTTTLRSKNLEIYFTKELDGYTDGRTQLFQPREDWFPESQFTLKADVVDSSHANNATLGRWINTEAARTILEDTPPMVAVKNNPPKDVVKGSNGNNIVYENKHTSPTVKHTLEGFQIILMITFGNETKPEMLGVYSFNLGRYSYYNMGLSFFKSFSRRIYNEITTDKDLRGYL